MEDVKLYKSEVTFDKGTHAYNLRGNTLKGVTPIVRWLFPDTYEDIPQSVLDKAAEYGSLVHAKCELYDTLGVNDGSREVEAYIRLKESERLTTIANEYLIDDGENIASSIDVVFDKEDNGTYPLADIKTTSKVHKDNVRLQLSIYACLFERCNKDKKAGRLLVIWLPKEKYGDPTVIELERIPADDCEKIIRAYLNGEDSTPYRDMYFGKGDAKEMELIEETLPATLSDVEDEIIKIKLDLKQMEERKKDLESGLYDLMVKHNVKKWQSDKIQIIRKLDAERESVDTARLKKEHPNVYLDCKKISKVKGSITINIL